MLTQITTRVNTLLLLLLVLMAAAIIAMLATRAVGGPLDPTGGPASTDSVRLPGTPISSIPYTISEPGSYYVTRSLVNAGCCHGILIDSSDVTIDLMGFTLDGNKGVTASLNGVIQTSGTKKNITVRNGTVRNWLDSGVRLPEVDDSGFEDLTVADNGGAGSGVGLWVRTGNTVSRVRAFGNVGDGIRIVSGSVLINPGGVVRQAFSRANGGAGLYIELGLAATVTDSVFSFNAGCGIATTGAFASIRDNNVSVNGGCGISLAAGNANAVIHNVVLDNGGSGAIPVPAGNSVGSCVLQAAVGTWPYAFWNIC